LISNKDRCEDRDDTSSNRDEIGNTRSRDKNIQTYQTKDDNDDERVRFDGEERG